MKFTYYGHACFGIETNGMHLLFDPFISANELAKGIDIEKITADYIFVSHGHADHILDCEAIAIRTGAKVICSWEVHEWLNAKDVKNTHPMNTGGKWNFEDLSVKCVVAQHSSSLPDGAYGGNPMGFIVSIGDESFYYSGDTALTMDMQLIPTWASLKFSILPIGDNFTMGAEDAILAAQFVQCNTVIGVHFDTFGFIKIDHAQTETLFANQNINLIIPEIGQTIDL